MPPSTRDRLVRVVLIAGLVTLGAGSLWRLWEQDIWWQVRAGGDLVASLRLPLVDAWSYSAPGGEWKNIQWLATLVLWAVHAASGVAGLVVLRGLLAATIAALVARVAWRVSGRAAVALTLAPLVWLACAYRLQVRSDTFVMLVFAVLVDAWTGGVASPRARRVASVGLVVLAANLHAGTAPFVVGAALAFLVADRRGWRADAPWLLALPAAFFLTPYHVDTLPILWRHVLYARENLVDNPDHRPLTWARFDAARFGFTAVAWALLVAAALLARAAPARLAPRLPPTLVRGPWFALLVAGLALLSVNRDRVVPYAALAAAPAAAALLATLPRPALLAAVIWLLVPLQLAVFPARWGLGEDERIDPVVAVAWMNAHHPSPQVLHLMGEGNYLLGHTTYPVFVDTRESMYRDLQRTYVEMVNDPALMAEVIARHDVRTVLLPQAFFALPYQGQPRRAAFFPKRQWAIVHFDPGWVVLVKRTPEHAALIAAEEYVFLVPYLAPGVYLSLQGRTSETDARFEAEVARCLARQPQSGFCRAAAAAWAGAPSRGAP